MACAGEEKRVYAIWQVTRSIGGHRWQTMCFLVIYRARSFTGHTDLDQHGKLNQRYLHSHKAYKVVLCSLVITRPPLYFVGLVIQSPKSAAASDQSTMLPFCATSAKSHISRSPDGHQGLYSGLVV